MSGPSAFRFADFEADVAEGALRRGGLRVRLQDLPFRLLLALAARPGEIVSREELRQVLWPNESYGDFGHRLGGALNRLREALGDPADRPRFIETVPRRGYRFCAAVEPIAKDEPVVPADPAVEPEPVRPAARRWTRLVLAAAGLVAATAGAWHVVPAPVAGDAPPAVAVLPFHDLSGADTALADGLTEDTISGLSRDGHSVIGRTTAMAYRGSGKRIDEIGRELGVAYVVEGSVRRGPGGLRVTVRLLAARAQTPLWTDSFDGDGTDPLAMQSKVARETARALRSRVALR